MNFADLKLLTAERLKDAKALLQKQRYSFAYHAAGFAVECALKACVLKRMAVTGWLFTPGEGKSKKSKSLQDVFTHDFEQLIGIAGLDDELVEQLRKSGEGGMPFPKHWAVVKQWKVEDRYVTKTQAEAQALYTAITDKQDGVLRWIKTYWQTRRRSRRVSITSAE